MCDTLYCEDVKPKSSKPYSPKSYRLGMEEARNITVFGDKIKKRKTYEHQRSITSVKLLEGRGRR